MNSKKQSKKDSLAFDWNDDEAECSPAVKYYEISDAFPHCSQVTSRSINVSHGGYMPYASAARNAENNDNNIYAE